MEIIGKKVLLRDFIKEDIEDRIRWETKETEWLLWDAPWESEEPFDVEQYRINMMKRINQEPALDRFRYGFQICILDEKRMHIGWINAYHIDEQYRYTNKSDKLAIGIDIPEMSARRRGFASEAWYLYINYLITHHISEIYSQTWSGNTRVIGLMKKLGFQECHRNDNQHMVRGETYDGLTFKLDIERFKQILMP